MRSPIAFEEAVRHIDALTPRVSAESVSLELAIGRVLAERAVVGTDQPPFDRAAMDGFAFRPTAGTRTYRTLSSVNAGDVLPDPLPDGHAVRIMTGAPCPPGTSLVPLENVDISPGFVTLHDSTPPMIGRNIARRGEDAQAGSVLLESGIRLSPTTVTLAAVCGLTQVRVHTPPRISILTTGDEVGTSGPSGIPNSNAPFLTSVARTLGLPYRSEHVPDDLETLTNSISEYRTSCDIIVTTGGVSGGDKDFVVQASLQAGFEEIFHHVAIQPGRPTYLARHPSGTILMGLPGNPVAVIVTSHLFLLRLIGRYLGGWTPSWLMRPVAETIMNRKTRRSFIPVTIDHSGIRTVPYNGSGDLIAASCAHGLIEIAPQCSFGVGETVRYLPYLGMASEPPRLPVRQERYRS